MLRQRPFMVVGKKNQTLTAATGGWRDLPELVRQFKINPTFELDSRIIEMRPREVQAALCLSVHTKWNILASLDALADAGIDLAGVPPAPTADFDNNYGTLDEHKAVVGALLKAGLEPVADAVINHRVGSTSRTRTGRRPSSARTT